MVNDDKKYAASNYIITFYKEIEQLTHTSGIYHNHLIEIKNLYGSTSLDKLEDNVKQTILEILQVIRLGVHKSYIQYNSIINVTKIKVNPEIKSKYDSINDQFIINFSDLQDYVIAINNVLVNEIIQDLLNTSNDLLVNMFNDDDNNKK